MLVELFEVKVLDKNTFTIFEWYCYIIDTTREVFQVTFHSLLRGRYLDKGWGEFCVWHVRPPSCLFRHGFSAVSIDSSENLVNYCPLWASHVALSSLQFSHSVLSHSLRQIPWTAAHHAFVSITNSWSLLKHMSIESVMPSNHLILCHLLLLLPSIFPSIRVFSNESVLRIRWPKY